MQESSPLYNKIDQKDSLRKGNSNTNIVNWKHNFSRFQGKSKNISMGSYFSSIFHFLSFLVLQK